MEIALYIGLISSSLLTSLFWITHNLTMTQLHYNYDKKIDRTWDDYTDFKRRKFFAHLFLASSSITSICIVYLAYALLVQN